MKLVSMPTHIRPTETVLSTEIEDQIRRRAYELYEPDMVIITPEGLCRQWQERFADHWRFQIGTHLN